MYVWLSMVDLAFPLGQPSTASRQQPPEEEEVDIQLTPPG